MRQVLHLKMNIKDIFLTLFIKHGQFNDALGIKGNDALNQFVFEPDPLWICPVKPTSLVWVMQDPLIKKRNVNIA